MMGRTHALSGTLAFGGAALAVHFDPLALALGLITATGAAMLPDLDHPKATMTKSMGPLSWFVCHFVILPIFGGHRKGTHSLAFVVIIGIGAQVALNFRTTLAGAIALWFLLSLSWSAGVRLLKIRGWLDDIAPMIIAAGIVWGLPAMGTELDLTIVPLAIMVGCAAHIAGDCLTDRGCPLFWPVDGSKWTLGLFTTGKSGELVALVLIIVGIIAELGYSIMKGIS